MWLHSGVVPASAHGSPRRQHSIVSIVTPLLLQVQKAAVGCLAVLLKRDLQLGRSASLQKGFLIETLQLFLLCVCCVLQAYHLALQTSNLQYT